MSINLHPKLKWDNLPPSPIAKTSTTKRSQREANFTVDEDIKLMSAWLNVSLDAVTSTDQKHTTFWDRIWSTFHNDKKFNCSKDSLCSRWSTIQRETNKFCGYLVQMENRNESDKTEHDKVFRLTHLLMTTMRFKILFLEWKLYFSEVRSVKKKAFF